MPNNKWIISLELDILRHIHLRAGRQEPHDTFKTHIKRFVHSTRMECMGHGKIVKYKMMREKEGRGGGGVRERDNSLSGMAKYTKFTFLLEWSWYFSGCKAHMYLSTAMHIRMTALCWHSAPRSSAYPKMQITPVKYLHFHKFWWIMKNDDVLQ